VHYEACRHLHRNIQQIKDLGIMQVLHLTRKPGRVAERYIAICRSGTDNECQSGFGGQQFIEYSIEK
jgi:ribulose-phosphate 3-epimerase